MQRDRLIGLALAAFVGTSGAMLAAPGQTRDTSTADTPRVKVANAGRTEALPVSIQEISLPLVQHGPPLKVEVSGKATVVVDPATRSTVFIDPASVMSVKLARQQWEYKQIKVANWDDPSQQLNNEGAQGWETTGVMFVSPGGNMLVLKRLK
jgi:hypothetical protein